MIQLRAKTTIAFGALLIASSMTPAAARAQEAAQAITPSTVIKLFDGVSLANFDPWLVDDHDNDPERVFSVVDQIDGAPAIRISGKIWGGLLTKQAYRDYRLIVEYRWGGVTWGDRKARARDSGVLLHAQGRPGNTKKDFNGPWLRSIEFQIIEGGVGDILPVAGFDEQGDRCAHRSPQRSAPCVKARQSSTNTARHRCSRPDASTGGAGAPRGKIGSGFRGAQDVESPGTGWTRIEAVVEKGNLTYYVNGTLVNAATDSSFTEGRIMIQSEGAEIYFRRIELQPLR